jgi:hypothetical protein
MHAAHLPYRRSQDRLTHYQGRPLIITVGGRRRVLTATDTQFLLAELNRLPETRWPAVFSLRERMLVGLSRGWPVTLTEDERPTLLRAVEGARTRRQLSTSLRLLRDALAPATVG